MEFPLNHSPPLNEAYLAFFERAPLGVGIVDAEQTLIYVNPALAGLAETTCKRLHNSRFTEVFERGIPEAGRRVVAQLRTTNKHPTEVSITCWPLESEGPELRLIIVDCAEVASTGTGEVRMLAANMAHQLRNPLAAISGALQVLRERATWSAAEGTIVDEMLERLSQLNSGIDRLVDFARPLEPKLQRVSLTTIVHSAADHLLATGFPEMAIAVSGDHVELHGDPDLLQRAASQLILNAAEATAGRGCRIRITSRDSDWVIEVADDGPGCAPDIRRRMFEPFYTTKSRHFGLGLATVRRIARAHGGDVVCTRCDETGTTMELRLPTDYSA